MIIPSVVAVAVLVFSAPLATAQMKKTTGSCVGNNSSQSSGQRMLTGIVSDTTCGARHMAKDKSPAECTRMCVKQGKKYALITVTKVYTLDGHEAELDRLAGARATVKGTIKDETITVESVTVATKPAKLSGRKY